MSEKTAIITGANSGIGKETVLKFANKGYSVVMACRDIDKSEAVQAEIKAVTNNDKIFLKQVDMASFASIKRFSEEIIRQFSKIDVLVNNAAYFNHGENYRLTADNIEITFATNVAGPYLLTKLLSGHLKKSEDARVLNVSSNIIKHFFSPKKTIDFENLKGISEKRYKHSVYTSYCNSKMALLMLTLKMAELHNSKEIKFYSLQVNGSRMSKETLNKFKPRWRLIARIQNLVFPLPEYMASNYYTICTSERFIDTTGIHLNHKLEIMKPGPKNTGFKHAWGAAYYPAYANDSEVQNKIYDICQSFTSQFI